MMISSQSFFIFFLSFIFNTLASPTLQRDALLEFKNEFPTSATYPDDLFDFSLSSWNTSSSDHCSWKGVICDANSGEVISLFLYSFFLNGSLKSNTSLIKLQHLEFLALSNCDLRGEIPSSLGNLSHLTELDLSNNELGGEIPSSLGNLSHLTELDLSNNELGGEIPSSLGNLSHFTELDLSNNELGGEIPSSIGNLFHLTELDISNNMLGGEIPSSLGNLFHLVVLDLSYNELGAEIPSSLGNLSCLKSLDLGYNHLIGEIPASIGNLNNLTIMSFHSNNFSGNIPSSFAKLKELSELSLSDNQFSGGDFAHILSNLTSLFQLDISNNHIKSRLPSNMSGLRHLEVFRVSGNSFVGNVPISLFTIRFLEEVYLDENQFEGPLKFGNTSSSSELRHLDLSSNNFYGPIPGFIFGFLPLDTMDLSHNSFIGAIPGSMSKLVSLSDLDLSYNKLEGQVPSFLWRIPTLKLSHNSFSSLEDSMKFVVNASYYSDLNPYSFKLPVLRVDLGSNSLRGSFPRWICKSTLLNFLDLSNNHLSGSIPSCLMHCTAIVWDIILRNNNFSGLLPDIFTNATMLRSLDVSRNRLVGKLPESLINCNSMEYLNLKGNKFKDTFPSWLSPLRSLTVLFLGSNAFYGPVSSHFGFPSLKLIDISHNNFNGTLPQDYFVNWLQMSSGWRNKSEWSMINMYENGSYLAYMGGSNNDDSMEMMYKGVDTEFPRIFVGYKAIDFSGNKFTGQIPESIGLLNELIHVNFSRNAFTGGIPSSFANITNLEALDLSHNKLSGTIPPGLASLSFVSYLDFSHNLLQGPVPQSTQFQSQKCSSYEDNLGLFGLEEICGTIHVPDSTSEESEEVVNWIAAAIAYGPGVFCGLVIGHIFFTSQKHK